MPGALALVFGRLANFMNAELLGRITTIAKTPWCINWFGERSIDGQLICRHPSQIYESLKNLFMFSVMFFMQYDIRGRYKKKRYQPGYLTWLFILIYGAGRAFVDIWREDPTWFLGTLSTGQVLSTLMAIIALIVLYVKYWRKR
ncbi:MAG: prolipoprotein diacylglyceryl transferase, partial [Simkania sp.]|nr:prolipoprotein diacylglyceryl transferase [Simkania sp.]